MLPVWGAACAILEAGADGRGSHAFESCRFVTVAVAVADLIWLIQDCPYLEGEESGSGATAVVKSSEIVRKFLIAVGVVLPCDKLRVASASPGAFTLGALAQASDPHDAQKADSVLGWSSQEALRRK
jgi:hypothetical protein